MTDPPRRTKTSRWRLLYLNYILHNAKHVNLSNVLVSLTHLLPSHCYNYHIAQTISFDDCWIWHYLPNDCDHLKRLQPFVHCCSFPASYVFGIVVADEKVRSAFHLPPSFLSLPPCYMGRALSMLTGCFSSRIWTEMKRSQKTS